MVLRFPARLAALGLLVGVLALPGFAVPAAATGGPGLVGTAPASAHGSVTFSYTITLPDPVDAVLFSTHQAAELPAAVTGVLLDGAPVPSGQISQPGPGDIAVQAGPAAGDGLAAGTHTLSFTASPAGTGSASTDSTATLAWSSGGIPGSLTSAPVPVEVNPPDLAVTLTPGTGEEQPSDLGTGQDLDLQVDVANLGYGAPHGTLRLVLPAGMRLGADGISWDDGGALTCVPDASDAQQLTCPLGVLQRLVDDDPTLDLDLTTAPDEPIGSQVPVRISATPDPGEGNDSDPTNNSVTAQVIYTGSAALSYTVTPAAASVPLGGTTTVRLTVHNTGPQPAPSTVAFVVVVGEQFGILDFTGQTLPPPGARTAARSQQRLAGRLVAHQPGAGSVPPASRSAVGNAGSGGSAVLWFAGDIPAGRSATATLTLHAHALGTARVGLIALSGAADPNCPDLDCDPPMVRMTVVPPPPIAPSGGGSAIGQGSGGLADTGVSIEPALLGIGLLLAGCGLVLLGRRPDGEASQIA